MRARSIVAGFIVVTLLPFGAIAAAQTAGPAEGNAIYLDNCSICHGVITTGSSERSRRREVPAVLTLTIPADGSPEPMVRVALPAAWREVLPAAGGTRVAVAPPYGPPLRGVYGRPAGSVQGFTYSEVFLKVLRGVIWDRGTLNRWITDSQQWVPGSVMYYKQADPEVRRKIIDYLETVR